MSGSAASRSEPTSWSAAGIRPFTCSWRASSLSKVSKIPYVVSSSRKAYQVTVPASSAASSQPCFRKAPSSSPLSGLAFKIASSPRSMAMGCVLSSVVPDATTKVGARTRARESGRCRLPNVFAAMCLRPPGCRADSARELVRQRRLVNDDQRGHGTGQAYVETPKSGDPVGFGGDDRRGLRQQDVVELQALRQGGRHQVEVLFELVLGTLLGAEECEPEAGACEHGCQSGHESVGRDQADRPFTLHDDLDLGQDGVGQW